MNWIRENKAGPLLELEVLPEGGVGYAVLQDDVGTDDDVGRHRRIPHAQLEHEPVELVSGSGQVASISIGF